MPSVLRLTRAMHTTALWHGELEMPWARWNTLEHNRKRWRPEFWFYYCLVKGWEVYFLVSVLFFLLFVFFFFLLRRPNKCVLESCSDLMLRGFFMTGTVTRDIAKANWLITFCCVSGQKCMDDFFWNLIKSIVIIGLFTSSKISFQG